MTSTGTAIESAPPDADIVAPPDNWYRGKRLIFAIALIVGGAWFAYDGWIRWPRENEQALKVAGVTKLPHTEFDIKLQKILAVSLPPLGLLWLVRIFYTSRGAYRLWGDTLSVPGHPEIPIDSVTQIDLSRWDRKGIAVLQYEHNGRTARFVLDDFIYQRKPTDEILDRIKARVAPEEAAAPAETTPTA
jgi:hypothetical protein